MAYEVLESKKTYTGKIVTIQEDVLMMPDGKKAVRETVIRGDAAAILPIDAQGNIVFVRQYRHAYQEMVLEIPAGMLEEGENPGLCAARELEEETGYRSDDITFLCELYPTVGFCTEKIFLYMAKNLEIGQQNFDEDEFIQVERYSPKDAVEMVFSGRIKDGKTIIAVLAYGQMK